MAQQARNLAWKMQDGAVKAKFLLRVRDSKFSAAFDQVFRSEGVKVLRLLYRAPQANSIAERFVLTARRELLDLSRYILVSHLDQAARLYSWSTPPSRSRHSTRPSMTMILPVGGYGCR